MRAVDTWDAWDAAFATAVRAQGRRVQAIAPLARAVASAIYRRCGMLPMHETWYREPQSYVAMWRHRHIRVWLDVWADRWNLTAGTDDRATSPSTWTPLLDVAHTRDEPSRLSHSDVAALAAGALAPFMHGKPRETRASLG